jgi:hypothetical protein
LQDPALNFRSKHVLAAADRQRRVGKCEVAIRIRYERFARNRGDRIEHPRVEHFPRANLLIHHLLSSGECVHGFLAD